MGRFLPKDEAGAAEPADEADEPQTGQQGDEPQPGDGEKETVDISDTVAPSIGPHTTVTRPAHSEPVRHEQSELDAMGLDKRREVVGKSYAPSFARQATMYGIFLAVLAVLVIGGKLLADELDKPPEQVEDRAVWTGNDEKPAPIDFRPAGNIPTEGP
jgi:hypothetical protein